MELRLPPALQAERLASIAWGAADASDRRALEKILRSMVARSAEAGAARAEVGPPPVHYCQAYCIDAGGAESAAAASASEWPSYTLLMQTPLPLPPPLRATACYNCRAEGHLARDCPLPRNPAAAPPPQRPAGQRRPPAFQGRYFDKPTAAGRPGALSAGLREQLGMGALDPPPYLPRMQRMGFPPAYLGTAAAAAAASAASGGEEPAPPPLLLHREAAPAAGEAEAEDASVPQFDYPGLNVPPPPGADARRWGWRGWPVAAAAHCFRAAPGGSAGGRPEAPRRLGAQ